MRIFLSYASQDRAAADAIRLALQTDGHDVFFDREDLPAGGEFHTRIRRAIEKADFMVFLVSPNALDEGSYTLSELSIAEKRWPTPDGRILPVILGRVERTRMPVYLSSVTFLETAGSVPAEVAGAVDRIARERRRRTWRIGAAAAAALVLAAGVTAWQFRNPSLDTRVGKDGAPAILIPAGQFTMGDDESSPIRQLFVDAFYLDRFEITVGRYRQFLESTGSANVPDSWEEATNDDQPVIGVSWNDAHAYCRWAGRRLPTEAEWEKAARGIEGRRYPWGDASPTIDFANYQNHAPGPYGSALTSVGALPAGRSARGVDDMSGNAAEWVADWFTESFPRDETFNPKGPATGDKKVIRGGGRYDAAERVSAVARQYASPETRTDDIGFRCASDA